MRAADKLPVETPAEWLRFAEENFRVAQRAAGDDEPAYHTVCFLCHSAAEKYLKAYLISKGWTLKKTHDLLELVALCAEHDPSLDALADDSSTLNDYSVSGRYPGDISFESIGAAEATEALAAAARIRDAVTTAMAAAQ